MIVIVLVAGILLLLVNTTLAEEIHTTKVFIKTIGPSFFNWTEPNSIHEPSYYSYRPSLINAPDLPSWVYYTYSKNHNKGFMYGAPPSEQEDFQIEVIGLNRKNYEARRRIIKMNVIEKADPALSEVQLKVDKLNVEDMLDSSRYNTLLDVFRKTLWPESRDDLYVTFLASATQLGARLPLNPTDGEGIVIHIGSRMPFSQTLLDLQKEVRPLRSKGQTNCPDFKHTSVERFFKQHNFYLDWCAFQLNKRTPNDEEQQSYNPPPELVPSTHQKLEWQPISKAELPTRHYISEMFPTLVVYVVSLATLVLLLNIVLCYWEDEEPSGDTPSIQYESVQRASNTLRSLSTQRDCDDSSPRISLERSGLRPNPPPYTGVHHLTTEDDMDDEDARTWYC